jgi:YHS domain-containing protein
MKPNLFSHRPICGVAVDEAAALPAEPEGQTFCFCGEHRRQAFLLTPATQQFSLWRRLNTLSENFVGHFVEKSNNSQNASTKSADNVGDEDT